LTHDVTRWKAEPTNFVKNVSISLPGYSMKFDSLPSTGAMITNNLYIALANSTYDFQIC